MTHSKDCHHSSTSAAPNLPDGVQCRCFCMCEKGGDKLAPPSPEKKTVTEFMECDTCRAKPGTPPLCRGCLHNRAVIEDEKKRLRSSFAQQLEEIVENAPSKFKVERFEGDEVNYARGYNDARSDFLQTIQRRMTQESDCNFVLCGRDCKGHVSGQGEKK